MPIQARAIIVIDLPWHHITWSKKGEGRSAEVHYATMTNEEILSLGQPMRAAFPGDSVLAMWTTGPQLAFAIDVLHEWGWKYKTVLFTWIKLNKRANINFEAILSLSSTLGDALRRLTFMGMGKWTRANAEYVLVATRGDRPINRLDAAIHSIIYAPVTAHSAKPDEMNHRLEKLLRTPGDQMIELFARRQYKDWLCTGLELDGLSVNEALHQLAAGNHRWTSNHVNSITKETIE